MCRGSEQGGGGGLTHSLSCFFFQAEDGIRDLTVTGVQTCALPILRLSRPRASLHRPNRRARGSSRNRMRRPPRASARLGKRKTPSPRAAKVRTASDRKSVV